MAKLLLPWAPAAAPPPKPTVGEMTALTPRPTLWLAAIFLPLVPTHCSTVASYWLCSSPDLPMDPWRLTPWTDPAFSACILRDPWTRSPPLLWGAYTAVASLLSVYMRLFLPRAPHAVRKALDEVAVRRVGFPLGLLAGIGPCSGVKWLAVPFDCVFLILIAAVLALWVRLIRTYGH
uniref:DUF7378 domain-containing protein n=1 Tax=Leersia perrieri TaxID=77586 RepID=A0A0D9UXB6_9ORYZ